MTTTGQPSNMPLGNPVRRVDFADFEEIKRRFAEHGEVKFCRCMASKNFPYCDGSHVELNEKGMSNAGPLVVKANPPKVPDAVRSGDGAGQPSNMPPSNPMRRVDFADIEELKQVMAQDGEKKYCRCFQSKNFPYCDGSHVELNKQGITNAGPLVMKASTPAEKTPSQPSNMPPDLPVRRVDVTDIEEIRRRFAENGEVKFCRCMASKNFPYCDGSHMELNKNGVTNVGPMVVKGAPLPETRDAEPCENYPVGKRPSNMPPSNPVRRVDFANIEELNQRFAQDNEVKFCRCMASKKFPYCDGSHVALNTQGITNVGPLVVKAKAPTPIQPTTPWGTPMPEVCDEAKSGNGTLENVGIKVTAKVSCPGCMQRFVSQEIQQLHWKFMHEFPKLQFDADTSHNQEKQQQIFEAEQLTEALEPDQNVTFTDTSQNIEKQEQIFEAEQLTDALEQGQHVSCSDTSQNVEKQEPMLEAEQLNEAFEPGQHVSFTDTSQNIEKQLEPVQNETFTNRNDTPRRGCRLSRTRLFSNDGILPLALGA